MYMVEVTVSKYRLGHILMLKLDIRRVFLQSNDITENISLSYNTIL